MKLRNRKTGKIIDFGYLQSDHIAPLVLTTYEDDKPEMKTYNSLAELNEEWEDYEDERQYTISDDGEVVPYAVDYINEGTDKGRKSISNCFRTKEEAEKAVEKLKAWKRLKDKGFRFYKKWDSKEPEGSFYYVEIHGKIDPVPADAEFMKDLDLLFGGEE